MSNKFSNFTTEELEQEVTRRRELPAQITEPDWTALIDYVKEGMDQVSYGQGFPKDFEHWIYETVLETIYGADVWTWINTKAR